MCRDRTPTHKNTREYISLVMLPDQEECLLSKDIKELIKSNRTATMGDFDDPYITWPNITMEYSLKQ